MYGINRRYQNKTFWLCNCYTKTKCTARVTTCGATAKLSNEHNHRPLQDKTILDNATFKLVTILDSKRNIELYMENIKKKMFE